MNMQKHIPNLLTLFNLLSGCIAIVFVSNSDFKMAFFFVCLGIFFDFFDGFLARKWSVAGPLGVQLDSLADMVTSGVAPGYVMYHMLSLKGGFMKVITDLSIFQISFLGFIITLGACYRLANFNIDTRQSDSFIGLPTPANALFIMSLPLVLASHPDNEIINLLLNKWVLIAISLLSVYVMNAEIPLFSLKIKDFTFQKYKLQIGFLLASTALLIFLQFTAVPLIIVMYVLLSVMNNIMTKK